MEFQDIQNAILQALHQYGVNWGGTPTNTASNLVSPAWIALEANLAYGRALAAVKDYPACIAPMLIQFPSMAGQKFWPMNPLPSMGSGVSPGNPAAMQVYECKYTQNGGGSVGQTIYIPFLSTPKFRRATAAYTARLGAQSSWPYALCQMFGRRQIDMYPATAVNGDTVELTICPDPQVTARTQPGLPCAQGGPMVNPTDVPLLIDDFHKIIVFGAVVNMAPVLNKPQMATDHKKLYDDLLQEMIDYGSAQNEGDAEQQVVDPWSGSTFLDAEIY